MTIASGRFDGKVAVVTGGASGIGEATVRRLSSEGASVVDAGDRLAANLPSAAFVQADVSTEDGTDDHVRSAIETFGRIDLFHNKAGLTSSSSRSSTLT